MPRDPPALSEDVAVEWRTIALWAREHTSAKYILRLLREDSSAVSWGIFSALSPLPFTSVTPLCYIGRVVAMAWETLGVTVG